MFIMNELYITLDNPLGNSSTVANSICAWLGSRQDGLDHVTTTWPIYQVAADPGPSTTTIEGISDVVKYPLLS